MIDQCQLFMSLVPRTNPRFLLTVSAVVILILSACSGDSHSDIEPRQLQARWLWDPTSTDLEDWQIVGRQPADIIMGEEGELFISDSQNARIIRLTTEGELIEEIGGKGWGPGELQDPMDLSFDSTNQILWIAERGSRRGLISRFKASGEHYQFLDAIRSPAIQMFDQYKCLVHEGTDAYWTSYFPYEGDLSNETRIKLYGRDNELLKSFGRLWINEGEGFGSTWMNNGGFLLRVGLYKLAFIWMYKPEVEIWTTNGTLLVNQTLETREIQKDGTWLEHQPRRVDYFTASCWLPERDLLYVGFRTSDPDQFHIYGLFIQDLFIREWYQFNQPEDEEETFRFHHLAIEVIEGRIRFFSLDLNSSGVMVLDPGR